MAMTSAIIPTEHASRYLQQLCKHWSHKMETEFDAVKGRIAFASGPLVFLEADPQSLAIRVESDDSETLGRIEDVVADHIKRFAFREELKFNWTQSD